MKNKVKRGSKGEVELSKLGLFPYFGQLGRPILQLQP
jgi:hypothetical protein